MVSTQPKSVSILTYFKEDDKLYWQENIDSGQYVICVGVAREALGSQGSACTC